MRHADRSPSASAMVCGAPKADSILLGHVRNGGRASDSGDAVAIVGARIARVGDRRELLEMRGPHTRIFEAPNGAIVPGFVDAHVHLVALARRACEVDCSKHRARSIVEIQELLLRAAHAQPAGTWIRAFGYDEAFLAEKRPPTVADLDAAAPESRRSLASSHGTRRGAERLGLASARHAAARSRSTSRGPC